ncbi:hypothetical protein DFH09DRAFT_1078613 [Mycena vulgaris]|nr:hypothetical protein DFH09DRAFT_1078613 [Mycena vulgaris]
MLDLARHLRVSCALLPRQCTPVPRQRSVTARQRASVPHQMAALFQKAYPQDTQVAGGEVMSLVKGWDAASMAQPRRHLCHAVVPRNPEASTVIRHGSPSLSYGNEREDSLSSIDPAQECTATCLERLSPLSTPHSLCSSMSSNSDETRELLQLVADSRLTGYLAVASLCVLIYDHLVCFPEELELMWKSRLGLAKIIYPRCYRASPALSLSSTELTNPSLNTSVIVREITTESACMNWLKVQGVTSTVIIGTVDLVLMLRVWILYGRPRFFIWMFACMAIAEVVTMIAVDFFAYAQMTKYVHLGSLLQGCYAYSAYLSPGPVRPLIIAVADVPRFLTLYAAVPLLVTFIMFVMTVYKCVTTLNRNAHHVMPVWKLFLWDGVVWFLVVFAAAVSELLIWTMWRETLKQLLVSVYSTVASRALLNIKAIMAPIQPQNETSEINAGGPMVHLP